MCVCMCVCVQTGGEGMRNRMKGKKGGVWGDFQESRGWGVCVRVACVCMCACVVIGEREQEGRDKQRKWGMGG